MPLPIYLEGTEDSSEQDKFKILLHPSTVCTSDLLRLRRLQETSSKDIDFLDFFEEPFHDLKATLHLPSSAFKALRRGVETHRCSGPFRLRTGTQKPQKQAQKPRHTSPLSKDQHSQYKYDLKSRYELRIIPPSYWMVKSLSSTRTKRR